MYGIIDIGSNTMRLNIYKYENDNLYLMLSKKLTAGLASYVDDGKMNKKGIKKAIDCLNEFKFILQTIKVEKIFVFATASLRNIKNSKEAKKKIEEKTGFKIEIITGEQEALLDFYSAGIKFDLDTGLLLDIGGGSTEIVLYDNKQVKDAMSLEYGSLSLFKKYVDGIFPGDEELKKISEKVSSNLKTVSKKDFPKNTKQICAVGGTARAVLKLVNEINDENKFEFQISDLKKLMNLFKKDENKFLQFVIKTIPDRVHTIVPGMIIMMSIAKFFDSKTVLISDYGIREGYLLKSLHGEF